ncbi:uncharacterized protein LOC127241394 isoform X2 [Andrographis paniculata]|uniref:uncharacterized protein LOC127241394 isoform X2 n=1 Tax=Andrographis paniculata TaxID=175694 RepID=UPI0021E6DE5A|nr:uncharacterized protein LOC127241394 isoform X2 [Andrographis paniculata]
MACGSVSNAVFLAEPWMPPPFLSKKVSSFTPRKKTSTPPLNCGCKIVASDRTKSYFYARNCLNSEGNPSSDDSEQEPPQEAVLKAISVSKTEGRIRQTTNMVIGGTVTDDSTNEWLALDQKVNSYPTVRGFTAIGTGGDDFVHAMVDAVESVIQKPVPEGKVKQKTSSTGKYVSVNIGPVRVVSSEQVQAVYNAMRRDNRMKYFL